MLWDNSLRLGVAVLDPHHSLGRMLCAHNKQLVRIVLLPGTFPPAVVLQVKVGLLQLWGQEWHDLLVLAVVRQSQFHPLVPLPSLVGPPCPIKMRVTFLSRRRAPLPSSWQLLLSAAGSTKNNRSKRQGLPLPPRARPSSTARCRLVSHMEETPLRPPSWKNIYDIKPSKHLKQSKLTSHQDRTSGCQHFHGRSQWRCLWRNHPRK